MTRDDSPQIGHRRDEDAPSQAFQGDLVDAIAREAARDAENVAAFLRELGLVPTADRPVRLPPAFLLQLGAALRVAVWEASGLRVHRDSGLPDAERAIRDAFSSLSPSTADDPSHPDALPRRVFALFAGRLAWHGRRDLDADVVLDDYVDEDDLVNALAELLWNSRHARGQYLKPVRGGRDE